MSIYEIAQLAAATLVLCLCIAASNRRGMWWVAAIVVNLVISTAVWVAEIPYAAAVVATLDFALCVLIYQFGRNRWEQWLFLLYQFSMLTSILYLGTMIWAPGYVNHDLYSTILEAVNYFSLTLIGTISGIQIGSDGRDRLAFAAWRRVRWLVLPVLRDEA